MPAISNAVPQISLEAVEHTHLRFSVTLTDANGNPIDLSGDNVRFFIADRDRSAEVLTVGLSEIQFDWFVDLRPGRYRYLMTREHNGEVSAVLRGSLTVVK